MKEARDMISRMRNQSGAALVIALGVTVILASLTAALLFRGTAERRQARSFTTADQSVIVADAGLNRTAATFRAGHIRLVPAPDPENPPDPNFPFVFEVPGMALPAVGFAEESLLADAPDGRVMGYPFEDNPLVITYVENTLLMGVSTRQIATLYEPIQIIRRTGARPSPRVVFPTGAAGLVAPERIEFLVRARGTNDPAAAGREVEAWMRFWVFAESIYNNAIAAGAAGTGTTGNVSVHGSIYVKGEDILLDAYTASGIARAHNSYHTSFVQQTWSNTVFGGTVYVPNDPNDDYYFETEDLDSRFQVFEGSVTVTGTASVGQADNYFTRIAVDGYYNGGATTDSAGSPFWGDEVSIAPGTDVPELDFPDVTIPGADRALHIDPSVLTWSSTCTIRTRGNAHGYYRFDPCTGDLEIGGQVVLTPPPANGVITLGTNSGPNRNRYFNVTPVAGWTNTDTGAGVTKPVEGGGLFADTGPGGRLDLEAGIKVNDFPKKTFGLYTNGNMRIDPGGTGGASWQGSYVGLYYAQGRLDFNKQVYIAGTVVGKNGVTTSQVPDIYQVPSLVRNLPPGAPPAGSILRVRGFLGFFDWRQIR
jgi:hypothetical protein